MRLLLAAVALVAAGIAITGCSAGAGDYFVGSNSSAVLLIHWSTSGSGYLTYDSISGTAPSEQLSTQTDPVTVTSSDGTLTFAGFLTDSFTGTISGDILTLTFPPSDSSADVTTDRLGATDAASYNAAVAKLSRSINSANELADENQAQAQQQQTISSDQQNVSGDVSKLDSDAGALSGEAAQIGTDVTSTQSDLGTEESDAGNGQGSYCDNAYTVNDDDYTVNDDSYTVGDDITTLTNSISSVNSDISQLNADVATLTNDGGAPVDNTQAAISSAQSAISGAVSQANGYIGTENSYLQQAYNVANNLAGSACGGPGTPTYLTTISS